jgi:hypothetical protein
LLDGPSRWMLFGYSTSGWRDASRMAGSSHALDPG